MIGLGLLVIDIGDIFPLGRDNVSSRVDGRCFHLPVS